MERLTNDPVDLSAPAATPGIRRIAIVGAGLIGASWATYFVARGFDVTVTDPAPDAEETVRRFVANAWSACVRLGLAPGASPDRLSFVREPEAAVDGADFVQESGPEREELKIALFARMDAVLPPSAIIASSTSGLLMSRVQSNCRHPERCVTGHPFNPPHLIPLVEVVGGERTSPETIRRTLDFYAAIGKRPIHLHKEVRGHVANRLQAAIWREAIHLVAEGVVSVADLDTAISQGPGLRWAIMGPHLTFHLAGGTGGMEHFWDHLVGPTTSWWKDLGHPTLTPEIRDLIIGGVMAEAAGRSVAEIAAERDRLLAGILELKARDREA